MFKQISGSAFKIGRRNIHSVPALANQEAFASEGIKGLYSAKGFQTAWSEYQKYLTINLTLQTNGTENELRTPYQILLRTGKNPIQQHIFHYASQAHNNHFVFQQLTDKETASKTRPSRYFMEKLTEANYSSLDVFKREFLAAAESLHGQGWVFLVESADKSFKIIKCNNDGTPYHYGKNQGLDLNGGISEASFDQLQELQLMAVENQLDFTLPLLGINVWDIAYLEDYGTTGKSTYLNNVWDCIDWNVVSKRVFLL